MVPRRHYPSHGRGRHASLYGSLQFVTVCTSDRKPVLASKAAHETLLGAWRDAQAWLIGSYVVMPDHIHLFCVENAEYDVDLTIWIRYWRRLVSHRWDDRDQLPLWQRDYWDTRIRSAEHYGEKLRYVSMNPVRAGLVKQQEDWPYAGVIDQTVSFF